MELSSSNSKKVIFPEMKPCSSQSKPKKTQEKLTPRKIPYTSRNGTF